MSSRITRFSRLSRGGAQPHPADPGKAGPLALLVRRFAGAPSDPNKASAARRGPGTSKGTGRSRAFRHDGQSEDADGEASIEALSSDQGDGEGDGERQGGWRADAAADGPSALLVEPIGRDRLTQGGPAAEGIPPSPAHVWPVAKLITAWKLRHDRSPAVVDFAARTPFSGEPAASVIYSPYDPFAALDEGEDTDRRWRVAQDVKIYEAAPTTLQPHSEPPLTRYRTFSPAAAVPASRASRLLRKAGVTPFRVQGGEAPRIGRIVVAAYNPFPAHVTDTAQPVPMILRKSAERSRASILPYEASEQGRDAFAGQAVKRSYCMPTPDVLDGAEPRGIFAIKGRSRTGSTPDDPVPIGPRSAAYRSK